MLNLTGHREHDRCLRDQQPSDFGVTVDIADVGGAYDVQASDATKFLHIFEQTDTGRFEFEQTDTVRFVFGAVALVDHIFTTVPNL